MGALGFFTLLGAIAWLAFKVRDLLILHEAGGDRIRELELEIDAVRNAFHRRVSELEQRVTTLPGAAPAPAPAPVPPPKPAVQPPPREDVAADQDRDQDRAAQPPPPFEPEPPPPAEPPCEPTYQPPAPPWGQVDWEQWIGVRGAALLGGIVLALAGALFLQYSIEHGLIPPIVRVAMGLLTGIGSIAASEMLRKRGYQSTANALAGAGVVILYASVWAARALYGLIGPGLAYALMILTTVACGLLSWRHSALVIAVLGLAGGFATPILLSTGSDNPIGLFAYVLMLDAGLMALARKRRWPMLLALGLGGTLVYQMAWIFGRMGPDRYWLGLAILAVFSAFFVLAGRRMPEGPEGDSPAWRGLQSAGILLPFAFALYFAANADLGPHLYPAAILIAILSAAACWLGRAPEFGKLPGGAAGGALGVVLIWLVANDFTTALAWEAFGICAGLAAIFHLFAEWESRGPEPERTRPALSPAFAVASGFLLFTAIVPVISSAPALWPWLSAWVALAALLVRQSAIASQGFAQIAAAAGLGLAFAFYFVAHRHSPAFPPAALFLALATLACALFQLLALRRNQAESRWPADLAAALIAVVLLAAHIPAAGSPAMPGWLFLASTLAFAMLTIQAATRLASGWLYLAAMALASFCHLAWTWSNPAGAADAGTALAIQFLGVALFTFWPFLAGSSFLGLPAAVYAAALAGPGWFLSLRELYEAALGEATIGVLPVVLGALSLAAVQLARRRGAGDPQAMRPLVWFAAVALSFLALAIPLQLDKEWITIGWAAQAVAILALWKRLDHPGLKYFALALLAAVTARLVLNPEVVLYHGRSGLPVANWLTYTYLAPAAALLGAAFLLRGLELPRARPWEQMLYQAGNATAAISCGVAAILVVFAWINLTIFDFFSTGSNIVVSFDRMAARDLTLSLAWALYALILLGIGMNRDSGGLRWFSLAFLMMTIGKVFLHDLGELEDLYRVASLVGLALSLILVSLAYQRFVFRKVPTEEQP